MPLIKLNAKDEKIGVILINTNHIDMVKRDVGGGSFILARGGDVTYTVSEDIWTVWDKLTKAEKITGNVTVKESVD